MIRKAVLILICLQLANLAFVSKALAEELVISITDNGSSSENQVNISNQNSTTLNQSNTANINNNITSNLNTGNNTASSNGGEAAIVTGDANASINIINTGINSSEANVTNCCNSSASLEISGNGVNSENSISSNNLSNSKIYQSNSLYLHNNINTSANTGDNKAKFNNGHVVIKTGSIKSNTTVVNSNINGNSGEVVRGDFAFSAVIKGNGSYSENSVNNDSKNNTDIEKVNLAIISNEIYEDLNSGGNEALGNLGDVTVDTGDIESVVLIKNENINSNLAVVSCACEEDPSDPADPEDPIPTPVPVPSTSLVQSATGASSTSGGAAGSILPKTGVQIPWFYVSTLFLIGMFLSGLYLRFNNSHGPPSLA